jgi:hypothetical protein
MFNSLESPYLLTMPNLAVSGAPWPVTLFLAGRDIDFVPSPLADGPQEPSPTTGMLHAIPPLLQTSRSAPAVQQQPEPAPSLPQHFAPRPSSPVSDPDRLLWHH